MYVLLLPFYFVTVFVSFFPWSIKLPWLTKTLWHRRDRTDDYLLIGTGIIFVIFTLVSTKLPHYTLPAFPLLALLLAPVWNQGAAVESRRSLFTTIAVVTACAWIAFALAVPPMVARFFPRISSFKCLARLWSRGCNLLRSSSRSQVWFGIFAPASKVFSRR